MRNLAIECSGVTAVVGLFDEDRCVGRREIDQEESTARMLAPAIEGLVGESAASSSKRRSPVDLISVTIGPGSFTGLRVGLATAKMLSMAWDVPLAGVDSLQAIAEANSFAEPQAQSTWLVVAMNAFRRQVFSAVWSRSPNDPQMQQMMLSSVVDAESWKRNPLTGVENLLEEPRQILVAGPALGLYTPIDRPGLKIAQRESWYPRVEMVAQIGARKFSGGSVCSSTELQPNYVRASVAEEKAAGR